MFRTFLATLRQIKQSYSSCLTYCQYDFENGKHLQNTFKQTLKLPSSVYDYDVINDSLFLILKMNGYTAASFYGFHVLEKQKLIKTNSQTDQVTWVDQRHMKVKSYEKQQLKLKYHLLRRKYYILKKVLYLKVSAAYYRKYYIKQKVLFIEKKVL